MLLGWWSEDTGDDRLVRILIDLDIEAGLAHSHDVAAAQPCRLRDSPLVDERAVGRPEILDLDSVVRGPYDRMAPRDLAVVLEENNGVLPPNGDLAGVHVEAQAPKGTVSYDQMGHSASSFWESIGAE
jgi:hypothetical protein